jgi:hypothetical protein
MGDVERLRERLVAAGVDLPAEVVELVVVTTGPMVTALDDLAALALDDCEPFCPSRRLPDDAA